MYIRNKTTARTLLLLVSMAAVGMFAYADEPEIFTFESAKGMQIKIIRTPDVGFVHAEIIIECRGDCNPTIAHLTVDNMFNQELHKSDSSLLAILKRLGNDFHFEHRVDYLKISVNFLTDKMGIFAQFIDELFSYKSFNLKRFNDSIFNFWHHFKNRDDWQKKLATQFAYFHLFPGNSLGNSVIQVDSLLKINLAQIRSLYRSKFQLAQSYLFIRGGVNPHIAFGLIENALKSYKKQNVIKITDEKVKLKNDRKILILNVISPEAPIIFWFQAIPPIGSKEHISWVIINNILFEYPIGAVFKKAASFGIRNIRKMDTDVFHHNQVSVICNTFRINYQNIEQFILMADNETRKLGKRGINRKEYLDSLNYFLGKAKVESSRFNHELEIEIRKTLLGLNEHSTSITPEIFSHVTLSQLNQFVGNFNNSNRDDRNIEKPEIIVIAGNARLIKGYLNRIKADYIYQTQ